MKRKEFDERQLWIRGNIFKHMVFFMGGLLLLNAGLAGEGIAWADGFSANLLLFAVPLAAGSVEMILRGVYFTGNAGRLALTALLGVSSLTALLLSLSGGALIDGGQLTERGCGAAVGLLLFLVAATAALRTLWDRKERKG
jgi:hypothetical protein